MQEDQLQEQTAEAMISDDEQPSQQTIENNEALADNEIEMIVKSRMQAEQRKYEEMSASLEAKYKEKEFQLYARDKILAEGLPIEIIPYLKLTDKDRLEETVKIINSVINIRYEAEIGKRIAGKSPSVGNPIEPSKEEKLRSVWGLKNEGSMTWQ